MLYFAYGSLVNRDRLRELCPRAAPLRCVKIAHHALCFTGHSEEWGGGTATIGLAPNRDLWGALYEIDGEGRAAVERSGARDGYVWAFTAVEEVNGKLTTVGMLVKVRDLKRSSPSQHYIDVLSAGWKEWGLDPESMLKESPPKL